jgi:hypothetical protein
LNHSLQLNYNAAIADGEQACTLDPANHDYKKHVSECYRLRGLQGAQRMDYDRVIADLTSALGWWSDNALAYLGRGAAHGGKADMYLRAGAASQAVVEATLAMADYEMGKTLDLGAYNSNSYRSWHANAYLFRANQALALGDLASYQADYNRHLQIMAGQ